MVGDLIEIAIVMFFFSSRRRHTRFDCDWSSDVCSSDLTKGVPWSPMRIAEQNRTEPDRKGRAEIDGKIEPAKNAREQVLVRFAELVADVCRDARLDPARTGSDEDQAYCQYPFLAESDAEGRVHESQGEMAEAVNDGEIKDRPIFPQPAVGDNRAEKRHPVNRGNELMEPAVGFVLRHALEK